MSIITKPSSIVKGTGATITLNKVDLVAKATEAGADSYFQDPLNWSQVIIQYKSSTGSQKEVLSFNATLATPASTFLVSARAKDIFQVNSITLVDFDGGSFHIPRSQLTVAEFDAEFDIDLSVLPVSALYNPDQKGSSITLSNNNLTASQFVYGGGPDQQVYMTPSFPSASGKKYLELIVDNNSSGNPILIGANVANEAPLNFEAYTPYYYGPFKFSFSNSGNSYINSVYSGASFSFTTSDILMLAIDLDNKKIWLGKNGSWFGSQNPETNIDGQDISSLSGLNVYLGISFSAVIAGQVSIRTVQSYKPASFTAI